MNDLAIVGGKIFDGFNSYDANIYVKDGSISAISHDLLDAAEVYNAKGLYILPGLIDPHVHFALKLGKYTSADDFESGSKSAAFGGITIFIDFLDPITDASVIKKVFSERMKLASTSHIDYSFHMTIAHPNFPPKKLIHRTLALGINSIKCFTTYSTSDRMTEDGYIFELLEESRKSGVVISFHAENDSIINHRLSEKDSHLPKDLPFFHPYESEAEAASRIATFARLTGGQAYIVHNSSGRSVDMLVNNGKPSNLRLETCPQYLTMDDSVYRKGPTVAALHTLVPPLRSRRDLGLLGKYFTDGVYSTVGTDHCPFMKAEKLENMNDLDHMPNGIGGVETSFSILYNQFVRTGFMTLNALVRMQSVNVADTFGLTQKGCISPGADADLALLDPNKKWEVTINSLHTRADYTPYEGMKLIGKFVSTLVRGKFVIRDGEFSGEQKGQFIERRPVFWHTH